MRAMIRASVCFFLLAAGPAACGPATLQPADLDAEIALAPGATAALKEQDIEVQFVAVVEDSRCPRDTTCVWAGEVKVQLSIRRDARKAMLREVLEGQSTDIEGYRVTLVRVLPQPVSTRKTPPEEYRATLKISAEAQ